MKKVLLLSFIIVTFIACSSVKKTQEALNTGDYDTAIQIALDKLRKNKSKKKRQEYIQLLEKGYAKIVDRELDEIAFMEKDNNPVHLKSIYEKYVGLDKIQKAIQPLLPLYITSKKRNANFTFHDYSDNIITSKNKLSEHLYVQAKGLMNSNQKQDFRVAYRDLNYINNINPNYKDVNALMDEAHYKGTNFVFLKIENNTNQIIPRRLEEDLLNIDTYDLNEHWTEYHSQNFSEINYDYTVSLNLRRIDVSPEHIRERQISKEKLIKDGWEYLLDEEGNVVKDSLGDKIKVDKFTKVRCDLFEFTQFKSAQVAGQVTFVQNSNNQLLETFPIASEFVFEHIYADYDGDKRALDNEYITLIGYDLVPFPSNEQMVYDTGEDLKNKLKDILSRSNF